MQCQNVVTFSQLAKLPKQREHPEVQLSWQWETASQKEDHRCGSGLVESEQPLYMHFIVLVQDVLFSDGQDNTSQAREDDGSRKDCLHSEFTLVSFTSNQVVFRFSRGVDSKSYIIQSI